MKRILALILLFSLILVPALAEDEEFSYAQIKPAPHVTISAPTAVQSYDAGGKLHVVASGKNITRMEVVFTYDGQDTVITVEGDSIDHTFDTFQYTQSATVTVRGYGETDKHGYPMVSTQSVTVLSPRDKIFHDMFALAAKNFKDPYYYHAPAQEDWDRGICKNFVMRMFDTFKAAYEMKEYPGVDLFMPKNNSKVNCKPYDYGVEWAYHDASEGNPFVTAATFRYNTEISLEENQALCRALLESVQAGDFFQMSGNYYYGNGAHSMLFIADYNPATDQVCWTDSNMKNDNVDGYHYGYMQYGALQDVDWFVKAICLKTRGCTIYRLREDLYVK